MQITVVGSGYVGVVTSACLAELGHFVTMVDIDKDTVDMINLGRPPIYEMGLEDMLSAHVGKNLSAHLGYDDLPESEIFLICVGTPSKSDGSADLSMVISASRSIGALLQNQEGYRVVAVRSTVPPRTTQNLVVDEVLACSGKGRQDIGFAMNPEFLREGIAIQDFMNPDRIVIGSSDERAGDMVESVYSKLNAPVLRTGISEAEMIKYASNALLAAKISFSNEIGNICKILGIDVYEVMRGVGMDHRISPYFLNAGAGFGGSCFPKDVAALIHLAEDLREESLLLRSVMEVNRRQPLRIVRLLETKVGDLEGKRIAVLGLAFKNDTDDVREARSIPLIAELETKGACVAAYDPKARDAMSEIFPDIEYAETASDALKMADACVVMTEWPEFKDLDKEFDLMKSRVIIEGRRILSCEDVEGICW